MVPTAAQTTSFFCDGDQMGILQAMVAQLQIEGITTISDLADFEKETLQQMADNLRKPGGQVPDPTLLQLQGQQSPHRHLSSVQSHNIVLLWHANWSGTTIP